MTNKQISKKFKIEAFIRKVEEHLSKFDGKLILKTLLLNNKTFDGEFLETNMSIKCVIDTSSTYWIGVLAHEYCHFLQCINGNKLWENFQNAVFENIDDLEYAFHKNGKKISKRLRKKIASSVIKMELDCDKSAIKIINRYKLPVNKKDYCSKANIILYKYIYWAEYGIWPGFIDKNCKNNSEYSYLKISKLMDEKKYKNISNIPKKILYIFENS